MNAIMALLAPLDRKILRDLARTWGQALAIGLVMASGVSLFILSSGMVRSLDESRRTYYERYRFADVFAPVKRAPDRVIEDIQAIPGVSVAEGRVSASILIDVEGVTEPIRGRAVSLPDIGEPALNRVFLRSGRMLEPRREDEILLSENFADAHGLKPGDVLSATMNGAKREFRIVGIAMSPEFIYTVAPGEIVPDDRLYGVGWLGREALGFAFDLDGAFNNVVLSLSRGANETAVIRALDRILEPYGATGAYGRDDQLSHKFVSSELDQLRTMGAILPPIFLGVAAFLLNVVIGRLIEIERDQIGLLKAFGYTDWSVIFHYGKYVFVIAAFGAAVGSVLGAWLGRSLALLYLDFFNFPVFVFRADPDVFATALGITFAAMGVAVFLSVRRAARLSPAEAMRPPAPKDYSRVGSPPGWLKRLLDQPSRMVLRRILREPVRSMLSIIGVGAATAVLILGRFNLDAVEAMMDINFNVADRYDLAVTFVEPQAARTIFEIRSVDGVLAAEPYRAVPVEMINGVRRHQGLITGLTRDPDLSRPLDSDLAALPLPLSGLLVSSSLAEILDLAPGDAFTVKVQEGRQQTVQLPVSGIAETYLGTPAYMEIRALNEVLEEGHRISGAYVTVDPARRDEVYARLKDMPVIAGVLLKDESKQALEDLLEQNLGTMTFITIIFSSVIAIGVIYNTARVAFSERARELASLRVLGFSKGETAFVLLGELAVLAVIALPIGCGLGYLLCAWLVDAFSSDIYRLPLEISAASYGNAVLTVSIASLISGILVVRDINTLDLVAVLKTRE